MALSAELGKANFTPESIENRLGGDADLHDKPTVRKIRLTTKLEDPQHRQAKFDEIANGANGGCPILAAAGGGGDYAGRDACCRPSAYAVGDPRNKEL